MKPPRGEMGYRKPGEKVWFEYHCWESPASDDAELWYRSHQQVKVLGLLEAGEGATLNDRCEAGAAGTYLVRFADGFEGEAVEDELLDSRKDFCRPDPPKRQRRNPGLSPWREAQEYESRLFGGAYNFARLRRAAPTAPIREMIRLARLRYNVFRQQFGLPAVTDWTQRPEQLIQHLRTDVEHNPPLPPGVTMKRAADFAETGTYLVEISGRLWRIGRDPESGAWFWHDAPDTGAFGAGGFNRGAFLGYSKAEALEKLMRRTAEGWEPSL